MSPTYPYLVVPGGTVIQLPGPNGQIDATASRSETVHKLIGGGTTVTKRALGKLTFSLPYTARPGTGLADLLSGLYEGLYGEGPFVFVRPDVNNVLTLDQSTFGLRLGADHGWRPSGVSTVALDGTTAPPVGVLSNVLKWTLAGAASAFVVPGISSSVVDVTSAPVYLPAESATFSVWLKASASAALTVRLRNYDSGTGAAIGGLASASASVTTSWQQFVCTFAPGGSGELMVPTVNGPATGIPASVWLAGAQVEYSASASTLQRGYGSPRVLITTPPGKSMTDYLYSNSTLVLAEI